MFAGCICIISRPVIAPLVNSADDVIEEPVALVKGKYQKGEFNALSTDVCPVFVPTTFIVVVGDGNGHVGIGFGKANEVASAVNKAKDNAKKNIFRAPIVNGTIPHRLDIKSDSVRLMLKPASPGTGIIAGGPVRAVLEQIGITDILTKNTGSTSKINIVRAIEKGLKSLRDPLIVARQRGITVKELFS